MKRNNISSPHEYEHLNPNVLPVNSFYPANISEPAIDKFKNKVTANFEDELSDHILSNKINDDAN